MKMTPAKVFRTLIVAVGGYLIGFALADVIAQMTPAIEAATAPAYVGGVTALASAATAIAKTTHIFSA